jgi:hypothetical protein
MVRNLQSCDNLTAAIEALEIETAEEAKARGMPPPIIKPLGDYVELRGGGFTTKDMARKLKLRSPTHREILAGLDARPIPNPV